MCRFVVVIVFWVTGCSGNLGAAPLPKELKKGVQFFLIGNWKLVSSDQALSEGHELIITITSDKKITLTNTYTGGRKIIYQGKYEFDARKMELDWRTHLNGDPNQRAHGEVSKIPKLDQRNLILVDPQGIRETFIRVPSSK